MVSATDLLELARHLKQEQLFVSAERNDLQTLNEKVLGLIEKVYHVSWISRQQKIILDHLILSHADYSPSQCCQKSNALEAVTFCDSYKQLKFHDALYGEFLLKLRENPQLLAMCLVSSEKIGLDISSHVNVILSSIYGNCILYEDELYVLKLLKNLIEVQLAMSNNPCRMLRHGSCAFSRVYKIFSEGLFSAKIFLTAALHAPILHLLMEDDMFLDIDPGKAVIRFPPHERLKRFGVEGTTEHAKNLRKYRDWTIGKLVNLTNRFIASIKQSMYCFPLSLSWLIKQVHETVMRAGKVDQREVGAMCADLLFSFFICPAIVNPEPYSITTDTPISYVARFNLMQVAQILQVLVMSKWEDIDPKLMDLYGKFEKDCMSSLLDLILKGNNEDMRKNASNLPGLSRSAVLVTEPNLMKLIQLLRQVQAENTDDKLDVKLLETCLGSLPVKTENAAVAKSGATSPSTPIIAKKNTLTRVKYRHERRDTVASNSETKNQANVEQDIPDTVLVVSINFDHGDCPGMLSAEKVLMDYNRHVKMNINSIHFDERDNIGSGSEMQEKRTRFSLSHDQDSIGNASDNLEAISEAASNHSGDSSIELENENEENDNDNFSDMVSANVSGRGTPNVSGRDTPSSQIEEEQSQPLDLPVTAQKQNREDIDDKFGKFEIKQLAGGGDETISMVSDTWSTDVLASDSENVEQSDTSMARTAAHILDPAPGASSYLDISETASDAWSTDVVTSDTDRLQDIDTDDTGSITTARSDDTARSEVDGDVFAVPSATSNVGMASPAENLSSGMLSRLSLPAGMKTASYGRREEPDGMEDKALSEITSSDLRRKHPSNSSRTSSASADVPSSPKFQILSVDGYSRTNEIFKSDMMSMDSKPTSMNFNSVGDISIIKKEQVRVSNRTLVNGLQFNSEQSTSAFGAANDADFATFQVSEKSNIVTKDSVICTDLSNDLNSTMRKDINQLCNDVEMRSEDIRPDYRQLNDITTLFDPLSECDNSPASTQKLRRDFADIRLSTASSGSSTSVGEGSKSSGSLNGSNSFSVENSRIPASDVPVAHSEASSGAIPKSSQIEQMDETPDDKNIFDDGMDKASRDKDKKSFFKSLKFPFKSRNKKLRTSEREEINEISAEASTSQRTASTAGSYYGGFPEQSNETGEDILAKYRKKPNQGETIASNNQTEDASLDCIDGNHMPITEFDHRNPEASFVFYDAKRKLRMVLGSADIPMLPSLSRSLGRQMQQSCSREAKNSCDNELVAFLNILLAEATNLEQRSLVAQLHEALRCVRLFDKNGCKKLFKSLREDYKKRSPYIAYLIKSRQGLLTTIAHLQRTLDRIERDKTVCNKFMISMCVRLFLAEREDLVKQFVSNFQKLTVPDEKTECVEKFLDYLYQEVDNDPFWKGASQMQAESAHQVIERDIMSEVYVHALYPNSDADVNRDQVLHEHVKRLVEVITPNHKYLCIPTKYHYECPWPSAQAEIITINAYKTPKDKLQCVLRCCSTIMNLLSMVSERSVPAADDFMPVLVYVLIKANPPSLLSTVQYVNSFYEKRLVGEESYWWTQFASAIEFIKTMDY